MARRQRLDLRLVELGLVASRQKAQQLIRAGKVRLGDAVLDLSLIHISEPTRPY